MDHPRDRSQEPEQRRDVGDRGEPDEAPLQRGRLDRSCRLDRLFPASGPFFAEARVEDPAMGPRLEWSIRCAGSNP
jgi:hypothetical protein